MAGSTRLELATSGVTGRVPGIRVRRDSRNGSAAVVARNCEMAYSATAIVLSPLHVRGVMVWRCSTFLTELIPKVGVQMLRRALPDGGSQERSR
jgi:hypothetical protein